VSHAEDVHYVTDMTGTRQHHHIDGAAVGEAA
jgi:hypothetical protein